LLNLGIKPDVELINKKLEYYSLKYNKKAFLKKVKEMKNIWEIEMRNLVDIVPKFDKVLKNIQEGMI